MPGPSRQVQGGYLGYSALGDSYDKTVKSIREGETERLEQEKLELANEGAVNDLFATPGAPTGSSAGTRGSARQNKNTTVVTQDGFNYSANTDNKEIMDLISPGQADPNDPIATARMQYRGNVAQQQKDLFKGNDFSLDGTALQSGGGFNRALQGALEGLKSNYVQAGRRTSPRKRREERLGVRNQLQSLKSFSGEIMGLQGAYKQAYDNNLISHGTKSEFIDFLNTVSGPNDLQVQWKDGRGFLAGMSASGQPVTLPLDNLESLKNGLILKQNNPAPVIDELVKETNKVIEGVDDAGVKTENNAWNDQKTNMVQGKLSQLLPDNNSVVSMGIDWLGFDGDKWKDRVANDPEGAKQLVVDTLTEHVKSQHQAIDKGGLTAAQAGTQENQTARLAETRRHNLVTESISRSKAANTGAGKSNPKDLASEISSNLVNPDFWGAKKLEGGEVLNSSKQGNVLTLQFKTGSKGGSPTGSSRSYDLSNDVEVARLIHDTYKDKAPAIIEQMKSQGTLSAEAAGTPLTDSLLGTPPPTKSNEIKSGTSGKKTPAQLAAEYRARKKS